MKTTTCPKRHGTDNPTWLVNEIVYYELAKVFGVAMPAAALVSLGERTGFGSEALPGREKLSAIPARLDANNLERLVRAVLLDVALLNSDRQPWNILQDQCGALWFFDHDKCLYGDGRPRAEKGDLGRIGNDALIETKITDYLACHDVNRLVWRRANHELLRRLSRELELSAEALERARSAVPVGWVSYELWHRLSQFLGQWWRLLMRVLEAEDGLDRVLTMLGDKGLV